MIIKIVRAIILRGIYVVLGAVIMLKVCQISTPQINNPGDEFVVPDLRQAEECINYQLPGTKILVGQVCHLENGFMYLYLPDQQHFEYLMTACAVISNEMEEEDLDTPKGRKGYF